MKIDQKKHQLLKAWPFQEALRIIKNHGGFTNFNIPQKKYILFETGYGPSGLPHIGTFGEVVRTSMIKNSLDHLTNYKSKIITFSIKIE